MTIKKPVHHTILLHQKEKWEAPTHSRLLPSKRVDHQKPIPLAFNPSVD